MNNYETNWFLLTGTTCSGKTSLRDEIAQAGYATTPEITRLVFSSLLDKGLSRNVLERVNLLVRKITAHYVAKLHTELEAHRQDVVFLDRGIVDQFAFYDISNIIYHNDLIKISEKYRYRKIFVLEPLEFISDGIRTVDAERRMMLHDKIIETCNRLDYDIIIVPVATIQERVDFILDNTDGLVSVNPKSIKDIVMRIVLQIERINLID